MRGDRAKPAIVYVAINIVNGKKYIGVTGRGLKKRASEHFGYAENGVYPKHHFYRAIKKYGRACFEFQILKECATCDEALQEEIRLIRELRPEYNITQGGGGRLGVRMSQAGIEKIRLLHRGNKYRLGTTHTAEVRERLREAGKTIGSIERFSQYRHLGPATSAKPVVCHDDGQVYESASAAARAYGVSKSAVIEICGHKKHRKTIGGRKFSYVSVQ